jgi:hypothetical protein
MCNRGIAVRQYGDKIIDVCFCPPSYYGEYCQYFSERLTVVTNFEDLTNTLRFTIKILAVFVTNETVLDHHEFHFTVALHDFKRKHKFYFVFPRPHRLSPTSNYTVRFELYHLNSNSMIAFLAVWIYPIKFTFLPSNRLAKVLRYKGPINDPYHICVLNSPCQNNGICHQVTNGNDKKTYWCECGNTSYGNECQYISRSCFPQYSSTNHSSIL